MEKFSSVVEELGELQFPARADTRIQMMPVRIGDPDSLPKSLDHWRQPFLVLCDAGAFGRHEVGYLTIDEKRVESGRSHRRPGLHVDFFKKHPEYDRVLVRDREIVMVSDLAGCHAWKQDFHGLPDPEGDCAHLASQCSEEAKIVLQPNRIYGMNRLTVHESVAFNAPTYRRFARLVGDILTEYYTNYTPNPKGIVPPSHTRIAGPRDRKYMDS